MTRAWIRSVGLPHPAQGRPLKSCTAFHLQYRCATRDTVLDLQGQRKPSGGPPAIAVRMCAAMHHSWFGEM